MSGRLAPPAKKVSASNRRASSFRTTRGSSRSTRPVPVRRSVEAPSPASTVTGSSSSARPTVLKPASAEIATACPEGWPNWISGLPGKGRRRAATRCLRQGELAVDVEARRRLAAADHLDAHRPVRADLAGDEPEWHAGGRALEAPRPGEFLAFDRDLLGIGLIRPAGRKDLRGHEKLRDEQAVDGEVAAFAPAEEIRRQSPAAIGADRDADVGPPDAGLEKADLAAQERRQRNLGPDELGVEGRPLIAGPAEPEAIEAQPRRRQEPDADPPRGVRLGPGRLRDRLVDDVAAGLPVDEGRRDDGRPEDQDHQAREDREDVAQEPPFSALCSRRFTSGGAETGA